MNKFNVNEEKYINEMISRCEQWKIIFIDGRRTNYCVPNLGKVLNKTSGKIFDSFNKKKEYSDYELARKHGVNREYVRDLRTHKRRKDYNF